MSKPKIFLVISLLGCGLAVFFLLSHREAGVEPSPTVVAGIVLYGYTDDGEISWVTEAEEGRIEEGAEELTGVTIRFPGDEEEDLLISAPALTGRSGLRRLTGGVRVELGDELRLMADTIVWNDDTDTLSSPHIELVYGKIEGRGERFNYDIAGRLAVLEGGVSGTISREEPISIRGERAEESEGRLVIEGDVVVESDGKTYRCPRLESDGSGEDIILSGGVTASLSDARLSADTIRIDQDGISVSGSVVLDIDLKGENGA